MVLTVVSGHRGMLKGTREADGGGSFLADSQTGLQEADLWN